MKTLVLTKVYLVFASSPSFLVSARLWPLNSPNLRSRHVQELANFCGECLWTEEITCTCDERKEELVNQDQYSNEQAIIVLTEPLEDGSPSPCIEDEDLIQEEEAEEEIQAIDSDFFCFGCEWSGGIRCGARVQWLMEHYGNSEEQAYLTVMEKETCGKKAFCSHCLWKGVINCSDRKAYLKRRYGISEEQALIGVMQDGDCILSATDSI